MIRMSSEGSNSSPEASPTLSPRSITNAAAASDVVDVKLSQTILSLPNLRIMQSNDQIRELQTIIRNKYVT